MYKRKSDSENVLIKAERLYQGLDAESLQDIKKVFSNKNLPPNELKSEKIGAIVFWIESNQQFFSDVLSKKSQNTRFYFFNRPQQVSKLSIALEETKKFNKLVNDFRKKLKTIIELEIKKDKLKILKPLLSSKESINPDYAEKDVEKKREYAAEDFEIAFLDSIVGIDDEVIRSKAIGSKQDSNLLHKMLQNRPELIDFLFAELGLLNDLAKEWERHRSPLLSEQVISWINKNKDFLTALLKTTDIQKWLENKLAEEINYQKNKFLIFSSQKKSGDKIKNEISVNEKKLKYLENFTISTQVEKLKSTIAAEKSELSELELNTYSVRKKLVVNEKSLDASQKYSEMIKNFLEDLTGQLDSTKIKKYDLLDTENLNEKLLKNSSLLKFLSKRLSSFDNLISIWRKAQPKKDIHETTELDAPPKLNLEIELKGIKRKEPESNDGKQEQVGKALKT